MSVIHGLEDRIEAGLVDAVDGKDVAGVEDKGIIPTTNSKLQLMSRALNPLILTGVQTHVMGRASTSHRMRHHSMESRPRTTVRTGQRALAPRSRVEPRRGSRARRALK